MKTKVVILMAGILLISMGAFAMGKKTEKINVAGKCGMCETRIEKAALAIDGVKKADYDLKTKTLTVTFDQKKTSVDGIEKAEAAVGHDTDKYKAEDADYNKLPGCCKYRK
ncbi:MAG: ATPase [Porphyromonadaceae bacterium]|nr:MAG: ATPase [Porphyromonadaceae bacterium]